MKVARLAVVMGVLLLLAAFAIGTELRPVATVDGTPQRCHAAVPASWLAPGSPDEAGGPARVRAACHPQESTVRWALGLTVAVGALALLAGWSSLREREATARRHPRTGSSRDPVRA